MELFPGRKLSPSLETPKINFILPSVKTAIRAKITGDIFLDAFQVCREIGVTCGKAHLNHKLRNHPQVDDNTATHVWNSDDSTWTILPLPTSEVKMIKYTNLKSFISDMIKRSRKGLQERITIFKKFNIVLSKEDLQSQHVPIECSVMDIFSAACPFEVLKQHRIGKYRLDAYIPRLKLAIEIDENGHRSYDENEEKQYNTIVRDHGIVSIRYVPDEEYPLKSGLELVKMVWSRSLSPDYSIFAHKNKLC
jgi:hypothetical protein